MDCDSFEKTSKPSSQNLQRPMTAPPSNSQLMSIITKSNSNKKEDDLYQCVKTALVELGEFVLEEKANSGVFEQDSQSIGNLNFDLIERSN